MKWIFKEKMLFFVKKVVHLCLLIERERRRRRTGKEGSRNDILLEKVEKPNSAGNFMDTTVAGLK
jgi:hypothetical protein